MLDVWQKIVDGRISHYSLGEKKGNVMIGGRTFCYNVTDDTITIKKSHPSNAPPHEPIGKVGDGEPVVVEFQAVKPSDIYPMCPEHNEAQSFCRACVDEIIQRRMGEQNREGEVKNFEVEGEITSGYYWARPKSEECRDIQPIYYSAKTGWVQHIGNWKTWPLEEWELLERLIEPKPKDEVTFEKEGI